jgi:hypothetical protein
MDISHIVVVGLTGTTLALLALVEIRSRRNSAIEEHDASRGGAATLDQCPPESDSAQKT